MALHDNVYVHVVSGSMFILGSGLDCLEQFAELGTLLLV